METVRYRPVRPLMGPVSLFFAHFFCSQPYPVVVGGGESLSGPFVVHALLNATSTEKINISPTRRTLCLPPISCACSRFVEDTPLNFAGISFGYAGFFLFALVFFWNETKKMIKYLYISNSNNILV